MKYKNVRNTRDVPIFIRKNIRDNQPLQVNPGGVAKVPKNREVVVYDRDIQYVCSLLRMQHLLMSFKGENYLFVGANGEEKKAIQISDGLRAVIRRNFRDEMITQQKFEELIAFVNSQSRVYHPSLCLHICCPTCCVLCFQPNKFHSESLVGYRGQISVFDLLNHEYFGWYAFVVHQKDYIRIIGFDYSDGQQDVQV